MASAGSAACSKRDSVARLKVQIGKVLKPIGRRSSGDRQLLQRIDGDENGAGGDARAGEGSVDPTHDRAGRAPRLRAEAVISSGTWAMPASMALSPGARNRML